MKFSRLLFAFATAHLLLISCTSDDTDNTPLGSYDNGVLVLNEGGFGEVSYISTDLEIAQNDVFTTVNGVAQNLGTYAQSMFFNGDRAYIISNGSNKITVVNRYSFEYIATIETGMQIPRYGVTYNGKAYITNMNDYNSATDDFITVINLADFSVETPIPVNNIAERLIEYNGKLYVSGGSFGMGDEISIVNIASKTVESTIEVGLSPNSLEERNGFLYVLCGTFTEQGKIIAINLSTNTIDSVTLPQQITNPQNLDIEGNVIYFTSGADVFKMPLNVDMVTAQLLFTVPSTSAYIGYGFAVNGNRVYISEAAEDFTSFGKVFIYSTAGTAIDEIPVGLGPNGFYFN